MGGKLSKKKKGYDVSDPKDKQDESPASGASAEESAKVEDGAPPTGTEETAGKDGVVEETAASADAAVTEAAVPPEEPKSVPSEEQAPAAEEETAPLQQTEATPVKEEPAGVAEETTLTDKEPVASAENKEKGSPVAERVQEEPKSAPLEEQVTAVDVTPVEKVAAITQEKQAPVGEPAALVEEAPLAEEKPVATEAAPAVAAEESFPPPSEEPVKAEVEPEKSQVEEHPGVLESVPEPEAPSVSTEAATEDQQPEPVQDTVTEPEVGEEETVSAAAVPEPEPEAEPAPEPVAESEIQPEEPQEAEPEQNTVQATEAESTESPTLEPEPEQTTEPETTESEPEQDKEKQQLGGNEPQPTLAGPDTAELETVEDVSPEALEAVAEDASAKNHHAEKESVSAEAPGSDGAEESQAAEPVPELVISQSVSANNMTAESDKAAEASLEEVPDPEPEEEHKMENGDLQSPSSTENGVDAVIAVNGECAEDTTAHAEEFVNGNEKSEESPVEDFELKKDVNLCGDIQEGPDAVLDMVEGLSTEVTQAV